MGWKADSGRQPSPPAVPAPHSPTVHERVAAARQVLRAAGIGADEAELSARVLAEHVLGWDAARFFTRAHEPEPSTFEMHYQALVARRAAREPLAYITGCQEFWGLPFEVTPAVLIPRPETELIVDAVLERFSRRCHDRLAVADACTGSGCVVVALARELPRAAFVATDISQSALTVARRNAARHGAADRIRFVHANLLDGITGPFDLIVANPPYVRQGDRAALQPEVRDYEPEVALFGGESGVDVVAALVHEAPQRLRRGGYFIFEFGFGQDLAVEELIGETSELTMVGLRRDLQGIARTMIAQRS
ncbi:MAG: peptide chain release factor N(5)-glutamine methyltransferase [Blastocatellia bacterium]|nr:MAG: peptide chain release factor N(5)-glutamine methyltransferase [Blastocatellia bacterium]